MNKKYKLRLFAVSVFFISFFFIACKKDSIPLKDNEVGSSANRQGQVAAEVVVVSSGSSIQAAVNAAAPNTTIRIQPGTYNEAIVVDKSGIQLIGEEGPNGQIVIIQNPGDEEDGIRVLDAGDGFVLKNVTVQNFEENGVFLVRVNGFTLSQVTTINNGEYGLFPVRCSNGTIEHCSATGHTDTGIYVGQSTDVTLEFNTVFANVNGLEIENCSDIVVRKNHCYDNVCGILSVLLPGLTVKTSSGILIEQNQVNNNNHINFAEPGGGFEAFVPSGSGILIVGTDNTIVKNNKVRDNSFTGIATVSTLILGAIAGIPPAAFADIEPNPDGDKITGNDLLHNGTQPPVGLPLPGNDLLWDGSGTNNCWSQNSFTISIPSALPVCN
jgi:parallel beta-helix repeat protein